MLLFIIACMLLKHIVHQRQDMPSPILSSFFSCLCACLSSGLLRAPGGHIPSGLLCSNVSRQTWCDLSGWRVLSLLPAVFSLPCLTHTCALSVAHNLMKAELSLYLCAKISSHFLCDCVIRDNAQNVSNNFQLDLIFGVIYKLNTICSLLLLEHVHKYERSIM